MLRHKTMKLLGCNMRENVCGLEAGNDFSDITPKT